MEALILVAGVVGYVAVAASIPFVLLWELLFGDLGSDSEKSESAASSSLRARPTRGRVDPFRAAG